MARQIPNMLSILRIILSILLIPFLTVHIAFIIIYILIGITDILDGFIARRFKCESDFGAKLDSIGDFVFYIILVFLFLKLYLPILKADHVIVLTEIVFLRFFNLFITKLKYKKVVFIHTIANKVSGVIVYFIPLIFLFIQNNFVIWIILIVVLIAALEELLITVKYSVPNLNTRSIFFK